MKSFFTGLIAGIFLAGFAIIFIDVLSRPIVVKEAETGKCLDVLDGRIGNSHPRFHCGFLPPRYSVEIDYNNINRDNNKQWQNDSVDNKNES